MTLARRLYSQFRQLIREGAMFLVVGGAGLVITNAVYSLLRHYSVGPVTATTVATVIAMLVTYLGNRYWSFRHRERTGMAREGVLFVVLNGIGLLIQDAVVAFGAYALGYQHGHKIQQLITLNVGIAIATVFRFWSYRKWVWGAPVDAVPAAVAAVSPVPPEDPGALEPDTVSLYPNGRGSTAMGSHGVNGNGGRAALNGHDPRAANQR